MNTAERLQNLNSIQVDNIVSSGKKPDKIVLAFTPRVLVFQNFKPNDKVVAKFSVKNISKVFISKLYLHQTIQHVCFLQFYFIFRPGSHVSQYGVQGIVLFLYQALRGPTIVPPSTRNQCHICYHFYTSTVRGLYT